MVYLRCSAPGGPASFLRAGQRTPARAVAYAG